MTLPNERLRAVKRLIRVADDIHRGKYKTLRSVKEAVRGCLRHLPTEDSFELYYKERQ